MTPFKILALLSLLVVANSVVDRTYFIYLGLPISATPQQIQQAYQQKKTKIQAIEDQVTKQKKSKLLEEAYKVLSNEKQRTLYEKYGKDMIKKTELMNMAARITDKSSRKDKPLKITVPVSVEDVYHGKTIKANFLKTTACPHCKGTGAESNKFLKDCDFCKGNGMKVMDHYNMYGQKQISEATCQTCRGSGKKITKFCPHCKGAKIVDVVETVEIKIPKGLPDGNVIKVRNFGDQPQRGAPSDLEATIIEIPTKHWARDKDNLIYTMEISFEESIFGFEKQFESLSGEVLKVSRTGVTIKTTRQIMKDKGIVNSKTGKKGSLIINFKIVMPLFTDRQLDMWEQFFESNKL